MLRMLGTIARNILDIVNCLILMASIVVLIGQGILWAWRWLRAMLRTKVEYRHG